MYELVGLALLLLALSLMYKRKRTVASANSLPNSFSRDLKMVMVVRTDLKMGHGKVAAQCCHACLGLYKALLKKDLPRLQAWENSNYKKVVVKCTTEEEMISIAEKARKKGLEYYIVRDAGLTQIIPGSKTVISVGPASEEELRDVTNQLKLL
jgi:peptidyl-tRNA hydrolase